MGWDTQINIIVENVVNEESKIAADLYETDAKTYWLNGIHYAKSRQLDDQSKALFFTYERRKYLPYWAVQEISLKYKDKYFTVVASCPDFIFGPAGVVKIVNGEILDSYGFAGERQKILENPDPELIFQWFGKGRFEEEYRDLHADQHPKKWIEELYAQNLIEFSPEQENELLEYKKLTTLGQAEWQEIKIS